MGSPDVIRLAPGDRLGDFEIVEVLAEGGSSTTYRARSEALDRDVELKHVRAGALGEGEEAVARARSEAIAVARLEHPGIAAVYAAGEHGGGLYVVSAPSTDDTLARRGQARTVTPDDAARIVRGIAEALAHAHEHGVLHRDLRPESVTISRWGHVQLRDFGVTRTSGRTGLVTRAEVLSSLRYAAPEVVLGRPATAASDVWSLAALAVWALTGAPPHADRPPGEYVLMKTTAAPPTLVDADGRPAGTLSAVVARGMAMEPGDRPSPAGFADELARAVAELPPELRAAAVPYLAREAGGDASDGPGAEVPGRPDAPADGTRVDHRRPVFTEAAPTKPPVPWTTYAGAVTVALIVGLVAFGAGRFTAPGPPATVAVGDFAVRPPDGWVVTSSSGRPTLRAPGGGTVALDESRGRLPGDPVSPGDVGGDAAPAPRLAGKVPLTIYRKGSILVVARPTTKGALWGSCRRLSEPSCAAAIVHASTSGRPIPSIPDVGVAGALREGLAEADRQTGVALSEMEGDRKARAAAADRLATSLRAAAGTLRADGADPATAAALARVSKALAAEAAAFQDLGDAFDRRSAAAADAAERAADKAHDDLKAALARFARAGYRVES